MSTPVKNGCLNGGRVYALRTVVQVMPRALAQISAARNGHPLDTTYTENTDRRLEAAGYLATIVQAPDADNPEGVYMVRPITGGAQVGPLKSCCFFGPAHVLGDVIDVGGGETPNDPPVRRIFIGYAFDYEFNPVVHTYDSEDTTAILDDCNTAIVDLEDSELWDFVFPNEDQLLAVPPQYEVAIKKNGCRVTVADMGRREWCDIWDGANG